MSEPGSSTEATSPSGFSDSTRANAASGEVALPTTVIPSDERTFSSASSQIGCSSRSTIPPSSAACPDRLLGLSSGQPLAPVLPCSTPRTQHQGSPSRPKSPVRGIAPGSLDRRSGPRSDLKNRRRSADTGEVSESQRRPVHAAVFLPSPPPRAACRPGRRHGRVQAAPAGAGSPRRQAEPASRTVRLLVKLRPHSTFRSFGRALAAAGARREQNPSPSARRRRAGTSPKRGGAHVPPRARAHGETRRA